MKKYLLIFATVFAIVSLSSLAVQAQVPYVQVFWDAGFSQAHANCPGAPIGSVLDTVHVAAINFNCRIQAAEFMVNLPTQLLLLGDIYYTPLHIGSSTTGVALSFDVPVDGIGKPALLMSMNVLWNCDNCLITDIPVTVVPHPISGLVSIVTWPDLQQITGVGMTSLICPTVATEETSWGQIKNLYN